MIPNLEELSIEYRVARCFHPITDVEQALIDQIGLQGVRHLE